jgi:hypothetical protein
MAENKLGKYLLYAAGEIILVVIGILIAIQINNANQRKIDKEALEGYLKSIAKNVESDLKKAKNIQNKRLELLSKEVYVSQNITPRVLEVPYSNNTTFNYSKEDVIFVSEALREVWDLNYLNANTSGFESLKSSGFLSKIQGKDIGYLLSNYYNLVNEIALEEALYNNLLLSERTEFSKADLEGTNSLFQPDYVNWDVIIDSYRPKFARILSNTSIRNSITIPYDMALNYDNLIATGEELIRLIGVNAMNFEAAGFEPKSEIFDKFDGTGNPKIIINGFQTPYYSNLEAYSTPINLSYVSPFYEELQVDFPGMEWGVFYIYVGQGSVEQLETRDYSSYNTLRLELKGEKGGEKIQISIKDETNPTDGSEAKVPLILTNEWKIYDIPLSKFEGTNLKKLFMPAAFIFEKDAAVISIKNIEYLKQP